MVIRWLKDPTEHKLLFYRRRIDTVIKAGCHPLSRNYINQSTKQFTDDLRSVDSTDFSNSNRFSNIVVTTER
jgi:hypothetical protein